MGVPIYIGIAFGIFFAFSCSTIENTEKKSSNESPVINYDQDLRTIDNQIKEQPANAEFRVSKAELLFNYAKSITVPSERAILYQNLFDTASNGIQNFDEQADRFQSILDEAWGFEQSNGVKLLQEDRSDNFEDNFDNILAHLQNAIILKPTETISYNLLATTYYKRGYYSNAISVLENAVTMAESSSEETETMEKLAYLFLEAGEYENSIQIYETLVRESPESLYLKHGLTNAYILNNQHQEASDMLQTLSEKFPARTTYQEALADEYFDIFVDKTTAIIANQQHDDDWEMDLNQLIDLLDRANTIYTTLESQAPLNEERVLRMAVFYKISSEKITNLHNSINVEIDRSETLTTLSNEYLETSLPLWERLAEISPENMEYMYNLYQIYTSLGMEEESIQLERNFNF